MTSMTESLEGLTQCKAVAAFEKGLTIEDLAKSLIITLPNSFADLVARAWKFMTIEESLSTWKNEHVGEKRKNNPEDNRSEQKSSSQFNKFTLVNAPKAVTLHEIEMFDLATPLSARKCKDMVKDPNLYWRYHKARGHHTEHYRTLKHDIEGLYKPVT
ncbi:hypothetical protein CDL15_Pgr011519 [Punica granatum]|uniref:Uncharacterized protein n=1 Tax=Punica granatum TaxID=22663 RepID=A0A218VU22_PUNGR|nr:hypothetical protein CDL15_Pgr011519 [Punica granatum]PKI64834.1 hypothetical protein CRG98_014749 [Punica granatum]